MQKEKKIRTYTRKTKTGKTVTVKAHTAKYDAAEEARKVFAKKAGAGKELSEVKKEKAVPAANDDLGFSAEDYKAWYHWDTEGDPKNASALKVKKALIAKMGRSAYNKYEQQMTDSYSARGHLKGFKGVGDLKSQEQASKEKLQMKQLGAKPSETPKGMSSVKVGNATLYVDKKNQVFRRKRDGSFVPETSEGAIDNTLRSHLGVSQSELGAMRKRGELSTPTKKKAIGKVEQSAPKKDREAGTSSAGSKSFEGHPKVVARIDKLVESFEKNVEKLQEHIDKKDKMPRRWITPYEMHHGVRRDTWTTRKHEAEKQIERLKKAKQLHIEGKENAAWKILSDYSGFNKNHVVSKDTQAKNAVAKEKKLRAEENRRIKAAGREAEEQKQRVLRARADREARANAPRIPADVLKVAGTKKAPVFSWNGGDMIQIGENYYKVSKRQYDDIWKRQQRLRGQSKKK